LDFKNEFSLEISSAGPYSFGVLAGSLVCSLFTHDFDANTEVPQFTFNVCWWFEHESWE